MDSKIFAALLAHMLGGLLPSNYSVVCNSPDRAYFVMLTMNNDPQPHLVSPVRYSSPIFPFDYISDDEFEVKMISKDSFQMTGPIEAAWTLPKNPKDSFEMVTSDTVLSCELN
jgi:hypothetical protein